MENIVYCSLHGKNRVRERCGVSKKSTLRCAELAVARGQHYTETKGSVRKWLDEQIHGIDREIYIHGDKAYIFATDSKLLITVLQMPSEIARTYNRSNKKHQRKKNAQKNRFAPIYC